MAAPKTILIVGGSRSIGLEIVRQSSLLYPDTTIFTTARNPAKATELQKLAAANSRIQILTADALDGYSLQLVAEKISAVTSSLDRVIYNAGVLRGLGNLMEESINELKVNMDTNVYGAYYTAVYFSPLLLASTYAKRSLVFMASSYGSLDLADEIYELHAETFSISGYDPTAMYNISKTAMNRLGKEIDRVLRTKGVPLILLHPGLINTEGNPWGTEKVEENVQGIMKVIESCSSPTSNKLYVDYTGKELPW